jgi:sugar lactone lactonase YvrE
MALFFAKNTSLDIVDFHQPSWSLLLDDPTGQKLNFTTNCAFGGPGLQDLYIANVEGDHFSRVHTAVHGHPLYHQR